MTKQKKIFWVVGNIIFGCVSFFAFLWGMFLAWENKGDIGLFGIGTLLLVLALFTLFNFFVITSEKLKYWRLSILIFIGSAGVTILIHGILQNIIFE